MTTISIDEAQHSLKSLVEQVRDGETITITEDNEAVARLIAPAKRVNLDRLRLEVDLLEIQVADDFDESLELVPENTMARYNAFVEENRTFSELLRSAVPLDPALIKRAEDLIGDFAVNPDDPFDPDEALAPDTDDLPSFEEEEPFGPISEAVEAVRRGFLMNELNVQERLLIRGADRFVSLIERFGGWLDEEGLADYLGIDAETSLQRVRDGSYLAISVGERVRVPVFQFIPEKKEVWPQIKALVDANPESSQEELMRFLVTRLDPGETDVTPLSMISNSEIDTARLLHLFTIRYDHGS